MHSVKTKPQFTESLVVTSKTRQLYDWLSEEGLLWMLDLPFDDRLSEFAGSLPVTRVWYRKLKENGIDSIPLPDSPQAIERAFVRVATVIRERFLVS